MKKTKKLTAILLTAIMSIGILTINTTNVEAATCNHEWTTKTNTTYKTQYRCKGCQKYFASKSAVTTHGKKTSKKYCGTVDKTRKVVASSQKYEACEKCGIKKSDAQSNNVNAHVHNWVTTKTPVTKQQVKCYGCGQWFDNSDNLKLHKSMNSSNKNCGLQSQTREIVTTSGYETCTTCGETKQLNNTGNVLTQSAEKIPSQIETKPVHSHTWVDHTATKQVPRTVHHDTTYETVTIPAVTKEQVSCGGCGQLFDSLDEMYVHAFTSPTTSQCGAYGEMKTVVVTPAHTEQKLVKNAYDETVYDTQIYVDYQYCSGCGQHK